MKKKLTCHCGGVEAEVNIPETGIEKLMRCNCTLCKRKGYIIGVLGENDFTLTKGKELLKLYQYYTNTAKHFFCSVCGIHTHNNPRINPKIFGVNVACIDGIDPFKLENVGLNDGQNHPLDKKNKMRIYNDCYKVVRRKCFNFIKSQETSKEKFKNKERMIKNFLIPVSFWISKKCKSKPYLIGLAGGQGTGKTTISSILKIILINYFKLNVFKISIDDFYKTRKDRINLSKRIHPMLLTRGAPGTHDIKMMLDFFKNSKKSKFKKMKLPLFDKSIDDRLPKKKWYEIKKRPDVIILEGWCVGAKAQKNREIKKPINSMEKTMDKRLKWRKFVNHNLQTSYKKLFKQLDSLLYLKASSFNQLRKWRLKQEKKLKIQTKNKKNLKIMDKKDVMNFMQTYQRITENMFKNVPKYASIIMNLNSSHQIKSVIYKK